MLDREVKKKKRNRHTLVDREREREPKAVNWSCSEKKTRERRESE